MNLVSFICIAISGSDEPRYLARRYARVTTNLTVVTFVFKH